MNYSRITSSLFLAAMCLSLSAHAEQKKSAETKVTALEEAQVVEAVECVHGREIRRLEVFPRKAGCNLQYFKAGKTSEVAAYRSGVDRCRTVLKQMRGNLEASGYHCK